MSLVISHEQYGVDRLEVMFLAWVSATDGSVTENVAGLHGTIEAVEFIPDAGGTQPDDLYDITLKSDDSDIDILGGKGANLSESANTRFDTDPQSTPILPQPAAGIYKLAVTNAGAQNGGTIKIYFRQ